MNIKADSRKVKKGDIFIALKYQNDGHEFIEDAIKNGADKIICEHGLYKVDTLIVKDTHEYLVNYLKENYYNLIKDLKLIAVTGTNGKTTSSFLIYQMLNKQNKKCGYIGTIGFYIDKKIKNLNNTTPDILDMYEMLIECKENGCEYVVFEASSHALAQNRLKGLEIDYAIFTNLTQDHLDYHLNMENYLNSKKKLFEMVKEEGISIINSDSEYKDELIISKNNVFYGKKDCDYKISDIKTSIDFTQFKINDKEYKTNLIGEFNIYNITTCIILMNLLKLDDNVENLNAPDGRMHKIRYNNNLIIIDYAHTPDAVCNVINTVKKTNCNKIITIIGCGGNRDKKKRKIMGNISTELSDYVILTSDNPRNEEPKLIINDMVEGICKDNYEIIENREEAIIRGIQLLEKSDILLVLGKGHEDYQIIGNVKYDFSDEKIVKKYI